MKTKNKLTASAGRMPALVLPLLTAMTDRQFQKLIDRSAATQRKFQRLLKAAEAEYERRYGANPSDVDDDQWIDSMHGACGEAQGMTVAEVAESARMCGQNACLSHGDDGATPPPPTSNQSK